jgi:hypothetical protein
MAPALAAGAATTVSVFWDRGERLEIGELSPYLLRHA